MTNVLSITTLSVSNLVGTFSASHIHQAPLGVNGPVIVNLPSFGSWSPTGPNMTWTQTSPIVLTAAQETAFLAGGTYINVHTNRFPGGEVRGQLYPVPEPATMAAMGLGLAVLAARKRRK